jgi:hypothetical protein
MGWFQRPVVGVEVIRDVNQKPEKHEPERNQKAEESRQKVERNEKSEAYGKKK